MNSTIIINVGRSFAAILVRLWLGILEADNLSLRGILFDFVYRQFLLDISEVFNAGFFC